MAHLMGQEDGHQGEGKGYSADQIGGMSKDLRALLKGTGQKGREDRCDEKQCVDPGNLLADLDRVTRAERFGIGCRR